VLAGLVGLVVFVFALGLLAMHVRPGNAPDLACRPDDRPRPCRPVDGRIVYIQRVDSDGDGDLHLLLISRQSVSAPGFTMLKINARLREGMDPGIGRWVSAVGMEFDAEHGERSVDVIRWALAH
jgi:hypothetical protein